MLKRIKEYEWISVLVAVASVVFGLLIGPAIEKIIDPIFFKDQDRALFTGLFLLTLLSIIAITTIGVFAQRREKDIIKVNDELSRINRVAELGNTARSLGIVGITANWTDFIGFKGMLGQDFKEHLEGVVAPATWYIVTHSPHAFSDWQTRFEDAVERRGIKVKWVYHAVEAVRTDKALRAQREWLSASSPNWQDRAADGPGKGLERLASYIELVKQWARDADRRIQAMNEAQRERAGCWYLYESDVPHFYMAFLAVPGECQDQQLPKQAPPGTFGFIQLYRMFVDDYPGRCALYLKTPGDILNYYYRSTVQLFEVGVDRGYLRCTWPLRT